MPLLPPRVIGPLSVCSAAVRVQGQVTGSTVDLFADGVHVGSGVAQWSDQTFSLNAGVTFTAGSKVTATQTLGVEISPRSSEAVEVQAKPTVIGYVGCKTHVYLCSQCLWLDGMVPGATVEVRVAGLLRGSGRADDGSARITLSTPSDLGDTLDARSPFVVVPSSLLSWQLYAFIISHQKRMLQSLW